MIQQANKPKTALDVTRTLIRRAEERRADPKKIWGLPWSFDGLNKLTGGIQPIEMTIVAARPGVGKTTILAQQAATLADYLATEEGYAAHPDEVIKLVLAESSAEVFQQRIAAAQAQVSRRRILDGSASQAAYDRYLAALSRLAELPIQYKDDARSLDEIVRFLEGGRKPVWWGLDYLQKVPSDNSYGAITNISSVLAAVAKRVAPGMVLSQLTREVEKREDRRPQMSDLRGSGQIEADARVILGLYRERVYQKVPPEEANQPHAAELGILKNNEGGGVGQTVELLFIPKRGVFEDISEIFVDEEED